MSLRKLASEDSSRNVSSPSLRTGSSTLDSRASSSRRFRRWASKASAGVVPPACRLRCAPSYHSRMYRPAPGPHLIRPRPSRSSETFFQPVRVLTWRVMLTRAIASTSGELDAIMDAKRVEVKLRLTKQKNYGGRACKPDSLDEFPILRPFCKLLKYKRWQQALNVNYGNCGNPEIIWGTV